MSLLTSKGDPNRPCVACDTRFELTTQRLNTLKSNGYQIVGRYLSDNEEDEQAGKPRWRKIVDGELERIIASGMKYFPIFQERATKPSHFTFERGAHYARRATQRAQSLGIPPTVIYFAVDYDALDAEVDSLIIPFFKGINANLGGGYGVGIYASRNVCQRVIDAGYAVSAFVSDMSTGFSGNLGFPITRQWNYDQFTEISNYQGEGWDLDRVAYAGRVSPCDAVLPSPPSSKPDPDPATPNTDPLLAWLKKTEAQCFKGMDGVLNPLKPYKGFTGEFILEWLRKPEYWAGGDKGLWPKYTPEPPYPAELQSARLLCAGVCEKQPVIKGQLPRRDIAHMAATALGYLTWGIEENPSNYGLGDLGGWLLDLLQIWGSYENEAEDEDLASWLYSYLGNTSDGKGFGYDDVLADADAWLIAHYMKTHPSGASLSDAVLDVFKHSETNRIKRFYQERFAANADNVVSVFQKLADGIDIWVFENFDYGKEKLLSASGASRLPDRRESETLARAYAAFLDSPRR